MDGKLLQQLDGKLRRTCYAITKQHLLENTDIIDKKQTKHLAEGVYGAIAEAVQDSIDYLTEYDILLPAKKTRKKGK